MKLLKQLLPVFLVFCLCLSGCGSKPDNSANPSVSLPSVPSTEATFPNNDDEMFTDRDNNSGYPEESAVKITLSGDSASATSDSVEISGSIVKITEEATYLISGTLRDGMLVVDAPDTAKLQIVLSGVSVTSQTCAPLYILGGDKVVVTLAAGTENTLANGGSFTQIDDNNIDGAVFSKQDLTFNGSGSLTVTSPAGHGIVCKDDLVFTGGCYTIHSASHAIDANDSVRATDTVITADAGKDGIHAENTDDPSLGYVYLSGGSYTLEAQGDGISAGSFLQISDGSFVITAGGGSENGTSHSSGGYGDFMGGGMGGRPGRPGLPGQTGGTQTDTDSTSMKGLKSGGNLQITGGNFQIDSADDAIHSDGSLYVKGGIFTAATGDDGFHAEDTLEISGGTILVTESYEGLEALHIRVSGGEITLTASDDGLNAAGGTDNSGMGGRDDGNFGGMFGGGWPGGGMSSGNGSIVISGGKLNITASGDGIDANGTLEITGGYTIVCGPTQGDTATLDYDKSAVISGGTFIGTGAFGMAQTFSDSAQGVIAVRVDSADPETRILLSDLSGNVLLSHTPALSYHVVILSCPELVKGQTYKITVGSQSAEFEAV